MLKTLVMTCLAAGLAPAAAHAVAEAAGGPLRVAATAPINDPVKVLLERARHWDSRDRADLARSSLEKLLRVAPEHPEALALMASVEAKAEHPDNARKFLGKLREVKPDHPAIVRIEALIRLYGADKEKFVQARQLAKQARLPEFSDQKDKALEALRELYRGDPPDGNLAL